jgi:hypothetical protein
MPRKCQSYKILIINYLVVLLVDFLFGFDTGGVRLWLKSGAMKTYDEHTDYRINISSLFLIVHFLHTNGAVWMLNKSYCPFCNFSSQLLAFSLCGFNSRHFW